MKAAPAVVSEDKEDEGRPSCGFELRENSLIFIILRLKLQGNPCFPLGFMSLNSEEIFLLQHLKYLNRGGERVEKERKNSRKDEVEKWWEM